MKRMVVCARCKCKAVNTVVDMVGKRKYIVCEGCTK